ncbi:hypothetical protein [Actinocorallia sp. A-T 12471]|uniref:hypothetical protein n=1 Tax=Actinocorallia sp. A-T 12471 TaxID=3089813 RepID=UPI0029D39E66|nr:hypothetical protein [Actinocorallia sp. A-T 12471]MDX6741482.1 hypothetical protein [Actinocorallia sp. A-T 12471]
MTDHDSEPASAADLPAPVRGVAVVPRRARRFRPELTGLALKPALRWTPQGGTAKPEKLEKPEEPKKSEEPEGPEKAAKPEELAESAKPKEPKEPETAEEPEEPEEPDKAEEDAPAAPTRRRLTVTLPAMPSVGRAATAVLVVALAAVSVLQWQQNGTLTAAEEDRRALEETSGKVASTFFNWDHAHMDESFQAKYALLTKEAGDAIRPTAETLTTYFTANKVSSLATIQGVYPGRIKDSAANVVVVIDTKVTTSASIQSNTGATLAISMKKVGGRWLAGNITLLSGGVEAYTDPSGKPIAPPESKTSVPGGTVGP